MSTQPEALRLADRLEANFIRTQTELDTAAELRRLHAVNAELLGALKIARPYVSAALTETGSADAYRAECQVDIAIEQALKERNT